MKRALLLLLVSTLTVIFYGGTIIGIQIIFDLSEEAIRPFAIPLRLPSYLYYDVFHFTNNDDNLIEGIFLVSTAFLFNVVMYFPFFYLVFTLLSRFRTKQKEEIQTPPLPPTFES